ncbi:hypothetical protein [Piscinibacter sp.]|uniref:hypothetical protein n=1 Tax=Piscinibacter sp. TaxID=1903157 RepID=UPI001DE3591B|nr:hypothetical protein [Piscinibacter sp.]MBK7532024.1 hypothetical protein [Piscinibacter sp.]
MAAMKSYGLMVDEGSGAERRLRLTELALRIVLDTRPDSAERGEMLRRAALSPNVCSEVHANWPDGLPSDETLHHYLVLERSFAPPNALAVKILKENQQLAKLSQGTSLSADSTVVDDIALAHDDIMKKPCRYVQRSSRWKQLPYSGTAKRCRWARQVRRRCRSLNRCLDPDGPTRFDSEFAVQPTEEMYEFLKDYIELRLKAMKRRATLLTITGHAPTVTVTPTQPAETGLARLGMVTWTSPDQATLSGLRISTRTSTAAANRRVFSDC